MEIVLQLVNSLVNIYYWMIIIYILMSWLPNARESKFGEILGKIVEPYLAPFRRFIPPIFGMLDISPIIAIIALRYAATGLSAILEGIFT
ncbi:MULTISPECIES: YggT family protein [unclassified Paenibacillus]|uniref:YggT family protein n=1 Tax=Paenibacillus provencensis TaxID=441151 RepID=A0ABW3PPD7_9BACL|nr:MULTISPECIES: YggT family protein [unclassified Paenibacillus]SFS61223.1 YggT family protein [Paenibacillus sp. 453mf]